MCLLWSLFGAYVHPVFTNRLTTTTMLLAVDRHATLKTYPHPTQWTTRLARHRTSKRMRACLEDRRRDHTADRQLDWNTIDYKRQRLSHARAPGSSAPAGKARRESQFRDS